MRVRRYRVDESGIVNPGNLRHQITWQTKRVSAQDTSGGDVYTWGDVITCKAQVRSLSGRELEVAQQKWPEAQYGILQYYVPMLSAGMQIAWLLDGEMRYLDVLSVNDPPGTGRYQTAVARDFQG